MKFVSCIKVLIQPGKAFAYKSAIVSGSDDCKAVKAGAEEAIDVGTVELVNQPGAVIIVSYLTPSSILIAS